MNLEENQNGRRDLSGLRRRLEESHGPRYWRSLEEVARAPEFEEMLHREFPEQASEFQDPVGRRRFLHLMAASLALGGLTHCTRQPKELIAPYGRSPEEAIPGKPLYFATAATLGGYAEGVLVESHMGRPTKIEGNPGHPASLGATSAINQAEVLSLYDPDRSQTVSHLGQISSWISFLGAINRELEEQKLKQGAGLRILTETVSSPTLSSQLEELGAAFPQSNWHQYEPVNRSSFWEGGKKAFGEPVDAVYRLDRADVILALDSDFLAQGPGAVRYARDFAARRRADGGNEMNRLYAVESSPSSTGASADHRLRLSGRQIEHFARAIAARLGVAAAPAAEEALPADARRWIAPLAADLSKSRGRALVVVGDCQPAAVHALAHAMNLALGSVGETVLFIDPVVASSVKQVDSLEQLVADMQAGKVEVLLILGGNPVFNAPADLNFLEALNKVPFRARLGSDEDETSLYCHWHIPQAHFLESWSDARAYDGTASIIQPLIEPLYDGRSAHEVLSVLLGQPETRPYDRVRQHWSRRIPESSFEKTWRRALHDGVIAGTASAPKAVSLRAGFDQPSEPAGEGLEIVLRPDPTIWDGRYANNGWLQELPKPLTRLTWDNVAHLSPATAERFGLENKDVVELQFKGRSIEAPVWISPGQADDSVLVHFGYGRQRVGRVGKGSGFNAYALRTSDSPWLGSGLEIHKTGRRHPLATVQDHGSMEGRHLVRWAGIEEFRENPHAPHEGVHEPAEGLSLYPEDHKYEGNAWGMAIDLNACTGCNACMVACQSENNIPVVGKEQVLNGREMHWIRVDRYYEGSLDAPEIHHQPIPCMHCENAPCEVVCPVGATVHSSEGLNDMVYNRCVGTRYCSNNCPYKVRRFNFLLYADYETPSLKLMRNPDVTVRSRGVMEKCTYCVQRINSARIEAGKEDREIRDGEITTACQQVCPSQAIVFGNINDPESRVAKAKADPRNYGLLTDLNTKPRTTYLAKLRNPNPEMESESAHG